MDLLLLLLLLLLLFLSSPPPYTELQLKKMSTQTILILSFSSDFTFPSTGEYQPQQGSAKCQVCSVCFRVTSRASPKWRICSQAIKCNVFSATSPQSSHPATSQSPTYTPFPLSLCLLLSALPGQIHRRAHPHSTL